MEVEELEAVLHAARLQLLQAAHDFGDGQAELRAEPARGLPSSAAARGQLDAHPDLRPDAQLLGGFENQPELGVFLDDRDDVPPDLVAEHGRLDVLGILEAVADDRRGVVGDRHDGQKLWL